MQRKLCFATAPAPSFTQALTHIVPPLCNPLFFCVVYLVSLFPCLVTRLICIVVLGVRASTLSDTMTVQPRRMSTVAASVWTRLSVRLHHWTRLHWGRRVSLSLLFLTHSLTLTIRDIIYMHISCHGISHSVGS